MESFFIFVVGCLIIYTVISLIKHFNFTKRGIYKNIVNSHLSSIKTNLDHVKKLPFTYYLEDSNSDEFTDQLATDLTLKLKRKGFKVLRTTVVGISEKLVIS